jgi:phosphoglycerol transferase MdoB-like AlkP superfamily enzyme
LSLADSLRSFSRSPEGLLARRLGILLVVYAIIRLVFLIDHRAQFDEATVWQVGGAFLRGMRFDVSAIVYSNLPIILLSLVPAPWSERLWFRRLMFGLFVVINFVLVSVMVADVGYYPFTGTRVTLDIFRLSHDASAQAPQLLMNYAGLASIAILLVIGIVLFYPRTGAEPAMRRTRAGQALASLAVLVVAIIGARGGVQKKPLSPLHAFAGGNHEIGVLTLNTAFTLLRSPRRPELGRVTFFANDADAANLLRAPFGYAPLARAHGLPRRQNIVVIMLESVGVEFWGAAERDVQRTPFLDSLAQHGAFFRNGFANGRRSMDALPSILLGVPLLMGQSVAISGYQANEWRGVGHFLGGAGYQTTFFHGAPKGTMYFDAISAMAGIERFHPLEDFPDSMRRDDFDGYWGLYDGPAMQWAAQEIDKLPQPFFSMIFTISTHHPYQLPPEYEGKFAEGPQEMHSSLEYLDVAVRQFFERVQHAPWYDNTLFIITGDHTAPQRSERYDTALGRFMVPILLFHPQGKLPPLDTTRIVQHVDLFPTILDYAGVDPGPVPRFGRSLFGEAPGEAILQSNNVFWIVRQDGVLQRDPDGSEHLFTLEGEHTGATPGDATSQAIEPILRQRLNAYLQHYSASLRGNSFYRDPR